MCTDKRGYSCLPVLPTPEVLAAQAREIYNKYSPKHKKYSPNPMQQVPSELSFFPGHLQVWIFYLPQARRKLQGTDTAQKCFTPLTWSPAKLWACTHRALICFLYLSNPNIPHTTQKSCCRALHLQSKEKGVLGQDFSWCNMYWQIRVDLAFHC